MIDHIGKGRCRLLIDSMHFFRSGGTVEKLEALDSDLIGYAQISDAPMLSDGRTYMEEAMFDRLAPGDGEFPLREWIAALPTEIEIGLEVPRLVDLRGGMNPRDHAARLVKAARNLGA